MAKYICVYQLTRTVWRHPWGLSESCLRSACQSPPRSRNEAPLPSVGHISVQSVRRNKPNSESANTHQSIMSQTGSAGSELHVLDNFPLDSMVMCHMLISPTVMSIHFADPRTQRVWLKNKWRRTKRAFWNASMSVKSCVRANEKSNAAYLNQIANKKLFSGLIWIFPLWIELFAFKACDSTPSCDSVSNRA